MLSYCVSGSPENPLVILAHGVTDCAIAWADYIEHLSGNYLVVAVDSLGHGLSPRYGDSQLLDPFGAAYETFEQTVEFIEQLFGKTAVVVGHSMGGALATTLALRRPDLCRGVILEEPAWLDADQKQRFLDNAAASTELLRGWASHPDKADAENAEKRPFWPLEDHIGWAFGKNRCDPRLVETGVVSFSQPWQQVVAALRVPTVVVSSDMPDDLVGVEGLRETEELGNPNVSTVFIAHGEHSLRRMQIDEFNRRIDPVIARWCGAEE